MDGADEPQPRASLSIGSPRLLNDAAAHWGPSCEGDEGRARRLGRSLGVARAGSLRDGGGGLAARPGTTGAGGRLEARIAGGRGEGGGEVGSLLLKRATRGDELIHARRLQEGRKERGSGGLGSGGGEDADGRLGPRGIRLRGGPPRVRRRHWRSVVPLNERLGAAGRHGRTMRASLRDRSATQRGEGEHRGRRHADAKHGSDGSTRPNAVAKGSTVERAQSNIEECLLLLISHHQDICPKVGGGMGV